MGFCPCMRAFKIISATRHPKLQISLVFAGFGFKARWYTLASLCRPQNSVGPGLLRGRKKRKRERERSARNVRVGEKKNPCGCISNPAVCTITYMVYVLWSEGRRQRILIWTRAATFVINLSDADHVCVCWKIVLGCKWCCTSVNFGHGDKDVVGMRSLINFEGSILGSPGLWVCLRE